MEFIISALFVMHPGIGLLNAISIGVLPWLGLNNLENSQLVRLLKVLVIPGTMLLYMYFFIDGIFNFDFWIQYLSEPALGWEELPLFNKLYIIIPIPIVSLFLIYKYIFNSEEE